MNVGGPAYHVALLSSGLDARGYEHLLLKGLPGPDEGSLEDLAVRYAVDCQTLGSLGPKISLVRDLRALMKIARIVRRWQPDIVHTHTAKAGMVGRLAARAALGRRVIVCHTYHGHVLTGYFGRTKSLAFRAVEMALARLSDQLIAVSQATVDDLTALKVAPAEKFATVPIGLDLDSFAAVGESTREAREAVGVHDEAVVVTFVGRLVPIKRVDVLLLAVARARDAGPNLRLVVVGDGPERDRLITLVHELGLGSNVTFTGFRRDLDTIARATDIAALTSDNEGTPVALIEASAAGRPCVAMRVGGVADIVTPTTGITVPPGDVDAFASALVRLAEDPTLRRTMGASARTWVATRFDRHRLVDDVDRVYRDLLAADGRHHADVPRSTIS